MIEPKRIWWRFIKRRGIVTVKSGLNSWTRKWTRKMTLAGALIVFSRFQWTQIASNHRKSFSFCWKHKLIWIRRYLFGNIDITLETLILNQETSFSLQNHYEFGDTIINLETLLLIWKWNSVSNIIRMFLSSKWYSQVKRDFPS